MRTDGKTREEKVPEGEVDEGKILDDVYSIYRRIEAYRNSTGSSSLSDISMRELWSKLSKTVAPLAGVSPNTLETYGWLSSAHRGRNVFLLPQMKITSFLIESSGALNNEGGVAKLYFNNRLVQAYRYRNGVSVHEIFPVPFHRYKIPHVNIYLELSDANPDTRVFWRVTDTKEASPKSFVVDTNANIYTIDENTVKDVLKAPEATNRIKEPEVQLGGENPDDMSIDIQPEPVTFK